MKFAAESEKRFRSWIPIGPKRDALRWAILLLGATLLTYANGLGGAFTYDDKAIVRDNPRLLSPRAAERILTTDYFGREIGKGTNYRPVLLLSYAVQWWAHGKRAVAFHAVNLLLHLAATLLLLQLLRRAGFSLTVARGAALLFAVHPIHVEAVTSLVGRGETLAAVFVLGYLVLALPPRGQGPLPWHRLLAALLCYLFGLLTKESAAVAPLLLFLLLSLGEEKEGFLRRVGRALSRGRPVFLGSALLLAGVFVLRARILGGPLRGRQLSVFELENPLAPLPPWDRIANASAIFFRYLGRTVFPLFLSADESAWSLSLLPARSPAAAGAVLLLLLLLVLAVARIRAAPATAFGILFFAVALLPTANLLFPIGTVFAERLLYLPSAGVCLILAAGILTRDGHLLDSPISRGRARAFAALALLLAARTIVRNPVWESDLALFTNTAHVSPGSAKAHYNLAYTLAEEGDPRGALRHYARAVGIYPRYFDAWAGKGRMEKDLGRLAEAESSYIRSIQAVPAYENGYFGLGLVREAREDWGGAVRAFAEGLGKKPGSLPLAYRLALARSRADPAAAEEDWRRALAIGPRSGAARLGYAEWLLARGRRQEARREAREALRWQPRSVPALRFLAERNAEEGRRFAEGLARERVFFLTRSREDRILLQEVARNHPGYAERFRAVRPRLEASAPWAFRAEEGRSPR